MIEFKDRLRELMDERGIKTPEELSPNLPVFIHPNTIRNYLNGSSPKNFEKYTILANFFNVPTDYLQGYSNIRTKNIDIKYFCNKYGLTEKSLSALERINNIKQAYTDFSTINTVNRLLEELEEKKDFNCIIQCIDYFLNLRINPNQEVVIGLDDNIYIWNKTNTSRIMGRKTINNETLIKSILIEIEDLLINKRNTIQKEGEKNECKRKN